MKNKVDLNEKDEKGEINIPNSTSFYAVLNNNMLYILFSRRDLLK